jgi:8-oxo-dGTP pyrophosphatase MutT (NUDIX family)
VLPKGSIGNGLTAYEAAVLEAYEEAGVDGRIGRSCIGVYGYTKRNEKKQKRCLVKVFPLRVACVLPDWPERRQRRRQWVDFRTAAARVQEVSLKKIMVAFERQQLHRARGRLTWTVQIEPRGGSVGRGPSYSPCGLQPVQSWGGGGG